MSDKAELELRLVRQADEWLTAEECRFSKPVLDECAYQFISTAMALADAIREQEDGDE